ncbi:tail terminator [Streptomyces phage Lizz]|jgi:hypothetical protein|nr:tail terminator [Streptomyces phage PHTowN]QNO12836.1 tail terminator [Streptomyces phage ShakeNBake]QYW07566.1 tail terminator [Streptomyces phage Lizz]
MSTPTAAGPFNELLAGLYATLDTGLDSAGVYDDVPERITKPYVTMGEMFSIPDNWHGGFGWDILFTTHVWTKARGFKSAIDIANEIIALLDHKRLAIDLPDSWSVVSIRFVQLQTLRDPDPEIRHVPVQFRIVIHQEV